MSPGAWLCVLLLAVGFGSGCSFKGEGANFHCEQLAERRAADCKHEVDARLKDREAGAETVRTGAHLQAQCITFPVRREQLGACHQQETCAAFADCFVALAEDNWKP